LSLQANPVVNEETAASSPPDFRIPKSTWGIAIDDSKVQRKLLDRLLSVIGIAEEKRIVLGSSAEEVLGFNDTVKCLVESDPNARFLVIADENLDIVEDSTCHSTISGSLCIERLRSQLRPDDEARVLAVVRSANDSGGDIALYCQRAHGFMEKASIRKESVIELIRPLWIKRFPPDNELHQGDQSLPPMRKPSVSTLDSETSQPATTTSDDLLQMVEALDRKLIRAQEDAIKSDWLSIRENLQVLKGDMMTMVTGKSPRVIVVLEALEDLRAASCPPSDVAARWKLIRALIVSLT
jgi:hypothetical protein